MARKRYKYSQRTLAACRKMGRYVWKVEYWNPYANRRIDAFNFIDILAIDPFDGVVAIQVCGPTGWSEHKKKFYRTITQNVGYAMQRLSCGHTGRLK